MIYKANKTEKITSIDYITKIESGKIYNFGGYSVKIQQFLTIKEFFSQHDLSKEVQEYAMEFGNDREDPSFDDDEIVVVFTNPNEDVNSVVYLPLKNFLELMFR